MDIHEQEQVDKLRHWWAQNGLSVCLWLGLSVSAVLGWRLWELRADKRATVASEFYEEIREVLAEEKSSETDTPPGDGDAPSADEEKSSETDAPPDDAPPADTATAPRKSEELFRVLRDEYPETVYAVLGSMQLAHREIEEGRLAAARKYLEWAVDNAPDAALHHLVRMRLVRILLALRVLDEAEQHLQESAAYAEDSALYQELWGDFQELRDRPEAAVEAYRKAYRLALQQNESHLPFLKIKLQALGVDPEELEQMEDEVVEARG